MPLHVRDSIQSMKLGAGRPANPATISMPVFPRVQMQTFIPVISKAFEEEVVLADGSIFVGALQNNLPNGHGKCTYLDGSFYQGQWVSGKREGTGRLVNPDRSIYVGGWLNDQRHGHGVLKLQNGDFYRGEWLLDQRNGTGVGRDIKGKYEGRWKDDKRHGAGKLTYPDGVVYEGDWDNHVRQGLGKEKSKEGILIYEGYWEADKRNGYGVESFVDGGRYEGYWLNDQKSGKGKLIGPQEYYDGGWANDLPHGEAVFTIYKHDFLRGMWVNGELRKVFFEESTISLISAANSISLPDGGGLPLIARRCFQKVLNTVCKIKPERQSVINQTASALEQCRNMSVEEQLKSIRMGNLTIVATGWQAHAVYMVFYKNQLLICNRGQGSIGYTTEMYWIKIEKLTTDVFSRLQNNRNRYSDRQAREFLDEFLRALGTTVDERSSQISKELSTSFQKIQNCWYASCKEAIKGAFTLLLLDEGLSLDDAITEGKHLKKICSAVNRLQLLQEYKSKQLQFFSPEQFEEINQKTQKAYNKCIATFDPLSRDHYPWLPERQSQKMVW
ncbi:MAG TPA: hypothetical protein VLE96_01775 [Chlamydiales bacterium]|nr:hypothetical protein [Chlamydiales bacterium]